MVATYKSLFVQFSLRSGGDHFRYRANFDAADPAADEVAAGMPKEVVLTAAAGLGAHGLGQAAEVALQLVKLLVSPVPGVNVEDEEPRGVRDDADVRSGLALPPVEDGRQVVGRQAQAPGPRLGLRDQAVVRGLPADAEREDVPAPVRVASRPSPNGASKLLSANRSACLL